MEVPGLMACGSMIQRSIQSGFRRPRACQEVGGGGSAAVSRIAVCVTLQAGRCRAAEQAPRHLCFLRGQHRTSSGM